MLTLFCKSGPFVCTTSSRAWVSPASLDWTALSLISHNLCCRQNNLTTISADDNTLTASGTWSTALSNVPLYAFDISHENYMSAAQPALKLYSETCHRHKSKQW